ncbi:MAG: alpha/beta hydrolase [Candidatus Omnitrophica bacterium]|nr:alpha/beta hydrolase [Candidatus Omnitrophota bacterium]
MIWIKIIRLFLILSAGVILILLYLRYIEKNTVFHPMKEIEYTPKELGLVYQDISFKAPDGVILSGWLVPCQNARYTVLFAHGNAGNISHRIEKIKFFHTLGCSVFIFDYRGYGKSKSSPSEKGLYEDAQGAYNYLLSTGVRPQDIIGYGESLGGSAIIDLASRNKLAALITDSAISSAKDMVKVIYPFLPYWVFSVRLDSVDKIKSITIPKLIIHSSNDEIVPYQLGEKLYEAAPQPKEFLKIHGGHNSGFFESEPLLKTKIAAFIKGLPA